MFFSIDPSNGLAIFDQIVRQMKFAVANGTLTRGEGDTAHKNAITRDIDLIVARPFGYGLGTTDRFRFQSGGVIKTGQLGNTEDTYLARALEIVSLNTET